MTANLIKDATTLWDIGAELDDINAQFHDIRNMLYIFDEEICSELVFMKQSDNGYVQHFLARYDTLHSMIDVTYSYLGNAIDAMQAQIDAVYEADKAARPRPTATE